MHKIRFRCSLFTDTLKTVILIYQWQRCYLWKCLNTWRNTSPSKNVNIFWRLQLHWNLILRPPDMTLPSNCGGETSNSSLCFDGIRVHVRAHYGLQGLDCVPRVRVRFQPCGHGEKKARMRCAKKGETELKKTKCSETFIENSWLNLKRLFTWSHIWIRCFCNQRLFLKSRRLLHDNSISY